VYHIQKKIDAAGTQLKILIDGKPVFNLPIISRWQLQSSSNEQVVFKKAITAIVGIDDIIVCAYNYIAQSLKIIRCYTLSSFIKIKRDKHESLDPLDGIKSRPQFRCSKSLIGKLMSMRIIQGRFEGTVAVPHTDKILSDLRQNAIMIGADSTAADIARMTGKRHTQN
jgi:hypothetical protein